MLLVAAGGVHAAPEAQDFPTRPMRLVVPFPAGGTTDVNARTISGQLERQLGQAIVVDNRVGANGIIATELVARAAPDGHTLLYVSSSISLNPSIYRKLPYDTVREFAPVTLAASAVGFLVVTTAALPVASVKELVALSRTPEAKLAFGSPGYGNSLHLAGEIFKLRTGANLLHVPYKGIALALNAVIGNEVQLVFLPPTIAVPQVKAGKARAIAFTGPQRWNVLPDVPTLAETIPGFQIQAGWDGVFAPARTPAPVIERIQQEFARALQTPKVRDYLVSGGYEPSGSTPAEFKAFFQSEMKRYEAIVKQAGIKPSDG